MWSNHRHVEIGGARAGAIESGNRSTTRFSEGTMNSLERKIPPPLVAAVCAAATWGLSLLTPPLQIPTLARLVAGVLLVAVGLGFAVDALVSFRRAKTTVNPIKPESTTSLVSSGVYSITRNPMYVGMLLLLIAGAVYLASPLSLLGSLAFFLYISRFQIAPEERALTTLFGAEYSSYQTKVRRWL